MHLKQEKLQLFGTHNKHSKPRFDSTKENQQKL